MVLDALLHYFITIQVLVWPCTDSVLPLSPSAGERRELEKEESGRTESAGEWRVRENGECGRTESAGESGSVGERGVQERVGRRVQERVEVRENGECRREWECGRTESAGESGSAGERRVQERVGEWECGRDSLE